MSWHWTVHSLPELKHLPWSERNRLAYKYWRVPYRHRWVRVLAFTLLGAYALLTASAVFIFPWLLRDPIGMAVFILFSPACVFLLNAFTIPFMRPHLRAEVGGLCPTCGYDTRATPDHCPECGSPVPAPLEHTRC